MLPHQTAHDRPDSMAPARQGRHFLSLPREIRDEIYCAYLAIGAEYGYVFNCGTGKLQTASNPPVDAESGDSNGGQAIDLSLMYTCRQIAAEMYGLPLRFHTITFTTLYSEKLRPRAGRWQFLKRFPIHQCLLKCVARMSEAMTQDMLRRFGDSNFSDNFAHSQTRLASAVPLWRGTVCVS